MMKMLRHLLLVGVLLGLFGNGVAVAAPCIMMTHGQSTATSDMPDCPMGLNCPDCAEKQGKSESDKSHPAGCMLMAGCSIAMAFKDVSSTQVSAITAAAPRFWMVAPRLAGRAVAPSPNHPHSLAEPNRRR
ncbi:hypothetical protein E6W36_02015 [Hankyongella ginsenosidimutans]|uniref:DUF2946 domain-containing protein n=1 Tax=Hankyongella ginsenosidimutans TaxID=1763828 RepID=A0A4D7BTC3_9SPHN|nr:hypothetical protein [Hankyongella ginsenosidimutans]QCI78829.1 hypothetical protein E6W36_02015 [Hankyongella ginsenosidimutans]